MFRNFWFLGVPEFQGHLDMLGVPRTSRNSKKFEEFSRESPEIFESLLYIFLKIARPGKINKPSGQFSHNKIAGQILHNFSSQFRTFS